MIGTIHSTNRAANWSLVANRPQRRNLGIDVKQMKLNDLQGRPRYLIDNGRYGVMRELV